MAAPVYSGVTGTAQDVVDSKAEPIGSADVDSESMVKPSVDPYAADSTESNSSEEASRSVLPNTLLAASAAILAAGGAGFFFWKKKSQD